MIYRIDWQHFLIHAIDHFTDMELRNIQYAIISAKVSNQGKQRNVVKLSELYPESEAIMIYAETQDKTLFEKMYLEMLNDEDRTILKHVNHYDVLIYQALINPLLNHYDVMMICDQNENFYIDVLCKHMKKKFDIEVIDLNELFSKGRTGSIYIDRDIIWDNAVDIRRAAAKEELETKSTTRDGKESIIRMMPKKEKIRRLKEYGIDVRKEDMKDLDSMLLEEWCAEDDQVFHN